MHNVFAGDDHDGRGHPTNGKQKEKEIHRAVSSIDTKKSSNHSTGGQRMQVLPTATA
jgi:hypothetical protein